MSRILFLFTGGTISMRVDERAGGAVPVLSGSEILALVPGLERMTEVEVQDFARLPGPHMTPARMMELSDLLNRELARPEIDAAILTHGTDTLEETAYLLDLRLLSNKPVAVVGALRNTSELGYDGANNLRAAVRVALDPAAWGRGVMVVLHDTIHAAAEVTKAHTHSLDAFQSPEHGPLGRVDQDRVMWTRPAHVRQSLYGPAIEERVDLFTMAAGVDGRLLSCSLASGARGVVIAGTGRGNVPPAVLPALQQALDTGVPVVIATRCTAGRVLGTYGYEGGGGDLRRRGVIFAGELNGPKARVKLMLALGLTRDPERVRHHVECGGYE